MQNDNLCVSIKDNGAGIPADKLIAIQEEIDSNTALNSENIGISNVVSRLRIYYHNDAKLQIKNIPSGGTEAVLIIPRISKSLK